MASSGSEPSSEHLVGDPDALFAARVFVEPVGSRDDDGAAGEGAGHRLQALPNSDDRHRAGELGEGHAGRSGGTGTYEVTTGDRHTGSLAQGSR